jgi:RimJ/RimL family protein N-acetyltransferase
MIVTETPRLILRHLHIVDAEAMERVHCDAEVMRFSAGVKDAEGVRKWLRGCLEDYYSKWGFGLWAVVSKEHREVIGYCGLSRFGDVGGQPETEVGYRLVRPQWGKGFATEAAAAVREDGFNTLSLSRLIAIIDPKNTASIRVAEKIGLKYEKPVIFHGFDVGIYAASKNDKCP